jgi:hypothetical protein
MTSLIARAVEFREMNGKAQILSFGDQCISSMAATAHRPPSVSVDERPVLT